MINKFLDIDYKNFGTIFLLKYENTILNTLYLHTFN